MPSFAISISVVLFLVSTDVQCLNLDNITCETNTCGDCYNYLVFNVLKSDVNQYNMQRAFFPPESADGPPVSVIVYYDYRNDSDKSLRKIWFWTASAFYHFQPLGILQFTSLFFSDSSRQIEYLNIILDTDCWNVSNDYMRLLTQRVST